MIKLEIENLVLGYGHTEVIKDLTFRVNPGEMVGLIGPNGSGKSTIIKAMSNVIRPFSGSVLLDGRNVAKIPRTELARLVGVVPQIPLLPSAF
ncbi:MAG: ATP-binding cassette domain-containing protein, partial [Dehalococcoidales bacterium]